MEAQKLIDTAKSRGMTMSEILQYDLTIRCLRDNGHQNLISIKLKQNLKTIKK